MQRLRTFNRLGRVAATVIFLSACGGSGSSSSNVSVAPPPPEPETEIRRYELGDVVDFTGTLSITEGTTPPVVSDVTLRMEINSNTYTHEDKNVLAARSSLLVASTEEESVRTIHFWQEPNGALYDLTDEYGNFYRNSATNENGLLAVPVPAMAHAEEMLQFYTLYGGHTSGYITMGERAIRIAESETLSVPLGTFTVKAVTRTDDYHYASTYDDHKRDERIVDEQTWWIDAGKAIIKIHQVYSSYSSSGQLQSTMELDIEAIKASF